MIAGRIPLLARSFGGAGRPAGGGGGGSPRTDLIFKSDWTGSLGSSSTVLLNGVWSITSTNFDDGRMEVIESTGLDFPSPNVLRVDAVEDRDAFAEMRATGLGVPAEGTYRTWRWYFRCVQPNGLSDINTHPIEDANGLTSHAQQWDFSPINGTDEYTPRYDTVAGGGGQYAPPAVPKGVTHRCEIQLLRVNATQFRLYGSIFDTDDNLLYDSADFVNEITPFDNLGDGLFTFADIDALDGLTCGLNGITPPAPFPFTYAYEGCFAVRDSSTDELIGPYHPDESVAA
jgi:hypothetical protein